MTRMTAAGEERRKTVQGGWREAVWWQGFVGADGKVLGGFFGPVSNSSTRCNNTRLSASSSRIKSSMSELSDKDDEDELQSIYKMHTKWP